MAIDVRSRLNISDEQLAEFCRKWKIARLELFGSALRDDFGDDSDIDLLVTFDEPPKSLFDLVDMDLEIARLAGRHVDLVERRAVEEAENYLKRRRILGSAREIYRLND